MDVARTLLIVAWAAGCYAPTLAENLPCSETGECPEGQRCAPATQRCVRTLPPDDAPALRDAPTDAPPTDVAPDAPPSLAFADDFGRADGDAIGNGWIEKTPAAFRLTDGEVTRVALPDSEYRDQLVYRPAAENVLDVEISIDFRVTASPPRYPQIFVRGVSSLIGEPDSYTGYLLYVDGDTVANRVVLGRQEGTVFVGTLDAFNLTVALAVGSTYRMTLRAEGTTPVTVSARIEHLTGSGAALIGQTTVEDAEPTRITVPGTVGFAGDMGTVYVYDRFRRTPL